MASIQRRFNSTGRTRIPRSHIEVKLQEPLDAGGFSVASANIDLTGLDLPQSAAVEIEAYFRSSSMRFPCGTVASIAIPANMELSEIDRGGAVRFRLLVIDPDQSGRIIAAADGLRPARERNSPDRQSLCRCARPISAISYGRLTLITAPAPRCWSTELFLAWHLDSGNSRCFRG